MLMVTKKTWREACLRKRYDLCANMSLVQALWKNLQDVLRSESVATVGFYWPVRGEPDLTAPLSQWARQNSVQLYLPTVRQRALQYVEWTSETPMVKTALGVREPAHGREGLPELLIVPCIGFDRQCRRLGYGGGYFDRFLATNAAQVKTVGVGFDELLVPEAIFAPFDYPLDAVVTPTGCFRARD